LELAKELWNMLKNFGTHLRTSEVKICLMLSICDYSHNKEYVGYFYSQQRIFLTSGSLIKEVNFVFACGDKISKSAVATLKSSILELKITKVMLML
jgi:hypothetical protein